MRVHKPLPSISNVAAGNKAVLNCPVGLTHDKIVLSIGALDPDELQNIEVVINGKVVQYYADGDELQAINDYYGRPSTTGFLTLFFERPELATVEQQRLTALGTSDVRTLAVQFDIAAGAVDPAITALAVLSDPMPLGVITKIRGYSRTFAVGGKQEIDSLPRNINGGYIAMHLFDDGTAVVDEIEVELNSRKVRESVKALGEALQTESGRVPQTALAAHVDFVLDGDIRQVLGVKGAQDFRVNPTLADAGAVRVVVELLDEFEGI